MSVKTASDVVIEVLANHGVTHVFLLPGGGNMYLVDAVVRNPRITPIPMLHEQSVGVAAEAYAQYRNGLGVALVTTGPGATNAITACAAAWADSTPVLFISGQVKQSDDASVLGLRQKGFQETPITDIVKKITKASIKLSSVSNLSNVILNLIHTSLNDRPGPVWLDIPLNLQNELIDGLAYKNYSSSPENFSQEAVRVEESLIEEIIGDWEKSNRPLILLGNGVRLANAEEIALKLVMKTQTPTLLTWKAIDFLDELDPLNAGRPGAIGQRSANFAQQTSDFLISIGARIDSGQSAHRLDNFAPNARKYVVDIDSAELLKFDSEKWISINADARTFTQQLLDKLNSQSVEINPQDWVRRIQNWKARYPILQNHHKSTTEGVNVYFLIDLLSFFMDAHDVFAPGSSGACSEISMQAFKVKTGQRVLNSEGLGPMGFGIPGAIGACVASGLQKTYCVDGDGGFMMNIQDLGTVAVQQLPIKYFVLNNDGYGSIKNSQDNYFEGRRIGTDPSNGLGMPSFEGIAQSFGLNYIRVSTHKELEDRMEEIVHMLKPLIIEVIVTKDQKTEPRVNNGVTSAGKLFTYPMEDMSPLLSLETLTNELLIPLNNEIVNRAR